MTVSRRALNRVKTVALALLATLAVAAPARSEWRWSVTPYLWAPKIGADVSVNDRDVLEAEVGLGDLIDKLDFAVQAHVEGLNGRHGLFFDATYLDLGDDDRVYAFGGPLSGTLNARSDLETSILEAGGIFNPNGDGTGFSLLYGARAIDVDQEIDARIEFRDHTVASRRFSVSKTLVDGMLGARVLRPLGERWSWLLRADASAGGTQFTWNAQSGFGYTFGAAGNKTLFVGYRYMELEFDETDARADLDVQNSLGGFVVGLKIGG